MCHLIFSNIGWHKIINSRVFRLIIVSSTMLSYDNSAFDALCFLFMSYLEGEHEAIEALAKKKALRKLQSGLYPLECLPSPEVSAFTKIYCSGNVQGMITMTGFDYESFHELLKLVDPLCDIYTPYHKKKVTILLLGKKKEVHLGQWTLE